ncbi:DUF4350 domain-containing protein [Tamlana fucoidanivorans]|uniref:DUF4350 domain-containing protein n=1 Tax=Allotamlana fucoidanivorans TaxID=2583814 RepID=A0A5C4SPT6_9FLAO|nr:DUF4350 domain-containing protein [Tamlana fucoidanivorans]TNJ45823.1 DUF4350 domain-containing protein [Tamlana fucoidanivorans]
MKKILPVLIILIVLVVSAAIMLGVKFQKTIDWEESFNETSNKPYGVSVLYKELPNLFTPNKVRTVYHQPASYLKAHKADGFGDHEAKGSFIIIGNSNYLEASSIDALLNFVHTGNTLFVSDYVFPQKIHDTLNFDIEYIKNEIDSTSYLSLKHFDIPDIKIDKNVGDNYFSRFDKTTCDALGYSKINYKHVNFIKIPFGEGTVFLHTEPKAFTNYNILKENRFRYIEGVLSHLPNSDLYFDSYSKIQTGYDGNVEKQSNLSWFLDQTSFKWAWYTAILFGILFMIFNAKRRQRIVKTIRPLQNTTVGFVETVSNLYFETQNHKNLVQKKVTYFLEKIRTDYNMDTSTLDESFIKKLASKSDKNIEDVKKIVDYINWLNSKNEFFEENLIKLNRHIESFYAK